jgi:hypothetical protein
MKISSLIKNVVSHLAPPSLPARPAATNQPRPTPDTFDSSSRKASVVSLGQSTQMGTNADYVKGLYKELLGREPDAGGMAAHLKGLETGMSRDDIRNVFLSSPEFAAKQARGVSSTGDLSATNRSFGTPVKSNEDPNTVAYVNSPQNKNVAPRSSFADSVNKAIDRVQAMGIGIDPADPTRITDFDKYHQAVTQEMLNAGFQAHYDGEELAVSRPGDTHSEQFDISTWKGEVRRFYASWQQPSSFAE